jgi:hypothetical protein
MGCICGAMGQAGQAPLLVVEIIQIFFIILQKIFEMRNETSIILRLRETEEHKIQYISIKSF